MPARRPWTYAAGGAVVAVAAVAVAIAVAGDQLGLSSNDERPAAASGHHRHHHRVAASAGTTPAVDGSGTASAPASPAAAPDQAFTLAGYYLGPTPGGRMLFREFARVEAADALTGAVSLLTTAPRDPDYSTPWESGDLSDARVDGEAIAVTVADARADRPAGMSPHDATEAVQQVVYTLQAAAQRRLPVRFSTPTVLGVDTSEPVGNAAQLDVLSSVSLTSPAEGDTVSGTFTASGVASSVEANVPWRLRQGDQVVRKGFTTAEGWMDKLYPWKADVDVSGLAPGRYTFVAMTDDPSSGEGRGPYVDTRSITVR